MELSTAEKYLVEHDKGISAIITAHGPITLPDRSDYFEALSSSIIGQQISVKAAAKIFERYRNETSLDPQLVTTMSDETSKAIGLSAQKNAYLRDLARHFVDDEAVFSHLDSLNDDDVIRELTKVKGIGVWTAQMFLLFTLQRPDIFAPDDRGLQLAVEKLYGKKYTRKELLSVAETWAPFRSTASLHLWKSLDNTPTT
jgi:DNA-3-methyladenine glycosylase II